MVSKLRDTLHERTRDFSDRVAVLRAVLPPTSLVNALLVSSHHW